jgi:hypothetical protein
LRTPIPLTGILVSPRFCCSKSANCAISSLDDVALESGHPLHKITAQRLLPLHRFLCSYIKKRQKQGAFQKCDPGLAAHAIVGMPSYYGLAKILFGVDGLKLLEDCIALDFSRLILKGLQTPGGSSRRKGRRHREEPRA